MNKQSFVTLFIDNEGEPIGCFPSPVVFDLDTRKLIDGEHLLKVISKDPHGKEGMKIIPFVVRNGPAIAIDGLKKNEVVDGVLPLMINAYGKGDQKTFSLHGSETPKGIPSWIVTLVILIFAWAAYFIVTSMNVKLS
jgi:hypothetical protein